MSKTTLTEALQRGRGVERPFNCPVHDDTNASASLNVVKNVWYCYACGAKGRATDRKKAPTSSDVLAVLTREQPPRYFDERWLDVYDATGPSPYWSGRVGRAVAKANRCGTDPMTGMPTYPLRSADGRVLGVVWRNLSEDGPKYIYPPAVSTSQTMFGLTYAEKNRPVVVVEGASDVMAIQSAFWSRKETVAVLGCYGAGLHFMQVQILAKLKPTMLVAAFDPDEAGKKASLRAQEIAAGHMWPFVSVDWSEVGVEDAAAANREQRYDTITAAMEGHHE